MDSLFSKLADAQAQMLRAIVEHARAGGGSAYLVGGAVRDWLLDAKSIDDLDFSVDGDSIAFARAVQRVHGGELLVHEKFRTARWIWQGASVDIAMSRAEEYPRPAALPVVRPAPIEVDLRRRDFAVNASSIPSTAAATWRCGGCAGCTSTASSTTRRACCAACATPHDSASRSTIPHSRPYGAAFRICAR
jgi:hypothetical protein